jgi:hypothetical protein
VQLARLASFLVFLALGLAVARAKGWPERRARASALIAWLLLVNLVAGVTQRDNWPFTSHTIGAGRAKTDQQLCVTEFAAVDDAGRDWKIDPYAWSPVYDSILQYWCDVHLAGLDEAGRGRVLGFLLLKAEASRRRLASGLPIGFQRRLGRLAAPYWWLLPRVRAVPEARYRGLRVYRVCWIPAERFRDPTRVERRLVAEHLERLP